jgi:hypothetical protein
MMPVVVAARLRLNIPPAIAGLEQVTSYDGHPGVGAFTEVQDR